MDQCTDCEERVYCLGGEAAPRGACPPGYYCPNNTKFAEEYPCPNGTYNPDYSKRSQAECLKCIVGHFCEKGTVQPYECPIGTYMPYGYDKNSRTVNGAPAGYQDDCLNCPAGFFCKSATVTPNECGTGYYTKLGQSVCQVRSEASV